MGDPVGQNGDGGRQAGQREPERRAAAPRGRRQLAAQKVEKRRGRHGLPPAALTCTVATAEAPMRKESSGFSTLFRTGKRTARRIQSRERSTRGNPLTLVPFSGSTAHPSPTTVPQKCLSSCDCR